ncbi:MAG: hypothetical protein AAF182_01885 [Pseudomonadota bacterium]
MSKKDKTTKGKKAGIKDEFDTGEAQPSGKEGGLFTPDELDIYVNKVTLEAYIFHGKVIEYKNIDHIEYNPPLHTVDIVYKDGSRQDLGVKIQWLLRPYFVKAEEINIVRTEKGEQIDGIQVPIKHKGQEDSD